MRIEILTAVLLAAIATGALGQTAPAPKPAASAPPQQLKAVGLGLVPYPAKKQSLEHQTKDDTECFDWTKQSTGIDPAAAVAVAATDTSQQATGTRARGAAAGAIVGEVADDKGGEGAAIGAATGAARSGRKDGEQTEEAKKAAESGAKADQAARLDTFRKSCAGRYQRVDPLDASAIEAKLGL